MIVGIGSALFVLVLMGLIEFALHRRNLNRIPIRVHVNGTRGKTETTRLIAAGLRAAGLRVMAKTTGTLPCVILEDGSQIPLRRRGPANIIENKRVVAKAAGRGVDALILECMAIQPEMQWVSERLLIRANIGLITNVRLDHTDHMGSSCDDVAAALALTMPDHGILITGALGYLETFRARADKMETKVVGVTPDTVEESCLARFGYPVFTENVALALETCSQLGLPKKTALAGMAGLGEEAVNSRSYRLAFGKRAFYLVNAFDANDPQSTLRVLKHWRKESGTDPEISCDTVEIGIFNNRADRGFRAALFIEHFLPKSGFQDVVVCGQSCRLVRRKLIRAGMDQNRVTAVGNHLNRNRAQRLLERVAGRYGGDVVLFGFGNIKGAGQDVVDYFKTHGTTLQ